MSDKEIKEKADPKTKSVKSGGSKSKGKTSSKPSSGGKRKLDSKEAAAKDVKKPKEEEPTSSDEQSPTKSDTDDSSGDFIDKINSRRINVCASIDKFKFNKKRVRILSDKEDFSDDSNGVVYWMARDHRVQDNWAFLYAQRLAMKLEAPLHICYCLVPQYLDATIRQYNFFLKGLAQIEEECQSLNIGFHLLLGEASQVLPQFVKDHNIGGVVTDFNPLRIPTKWVNDLKETLPKEVPLCQVDAHNLVPCWEASDKLEYGARTIRKKIHDKLGEFLTEFPPLVKHPHKLSKKPVATDWKAADAFLTVDREVSDVTWATPGTEGGLRMLESFCKQRLKRYSTSRNDPNKEALSNLSPWMHFGMISVQRCVLQVKMYRSYSSEGVNAFIEEAVIRKELADNFCYYNENYDNIKGTNDWAEKSLKIHKDDKRPYLYDREKLEQGETHDDLWNAAQIQLVTEGKMHGFLRMYWAKKILEWTSSPDFALKEAIYLNDKYSLDGRDPNGYAGVMWSICGIHDQGWAERDVFGKIRYMNYKGCQRKFDVPAFVKKYQKKKA